MSHHRFEHSSPAVKKNLALFHLPSTELGVERVQWVNYRPVSQSDEGPIEFVVSGAGRHYVDLQNTKLFIKAKIVKPDGSSLPSILKDSSAPPTAENMNSEAFASPANLWLHTLFSQIDLLMQQELVQTSTLYPYRSYIETLIYPYEPCLGESEMYYKDSFMAMDATKVLVENNEGLDRRNFRGIKSNEIDMEGTLHMDLCQQSRYILNGVDIGLRLWHARDSFRLMSEIGECEVKITDAVLKVCKVEISPALLNTHNNVMKHTMTAKYPYERTEMKSFSIMPGLLSFDSEDLFQGEVPNKIICGIVTSSAFNGHYQKNAFNFQHAYISEIGITVDDVPVPQKSLHTKFGNHNMAAEAFRTLFEDNPDLNITRDEYEHGYTLFSFTLRKGSHEYMNTLQKGNCSIHMKFDKVTKENMTLIIMARFPHVLEIDNDCKVSV